MKALSSSYVAKYAIDKMFERKLIIIPSFYMKFVCFLTRFVPTKLVLKVTYNIQNRKKGSR